MRGSTHSGSILALTRAQRRDVSTSSADMTKRGVFLKRAEPGKIANLALRAPRYSFFAPSFTSFMPMCESSPARRETWTLCSAASSSLNWMPICLATVRSWL